MTIEARYRDAGLPIAERVADLLARMTLEEKVAQLGSVWSFEIVGRGTLDRARSRELARRRDRPDQPRGRRDEPRRVRASPRWPTTIQRFLVEETRLGIPAIVHEESLHGLLARDAPCFQQSIGAAAAWDAELVEAMAATIRRRMLATAPGSPWRRSSTSPAIRAGAGSRRRTARIRTWPPSSAVAYVRGPPGRRRSRTASSRPPSTWSATASPRAGCNKAPAHLGPREMRDEQLFPFEAAVREAGVAQRHARLLRRRRGAVPRLARAADRHPP